MLPVTRSVLSAPALKEHVVSRYDLGVARDVEFLKMGLNDTYRVRTDDRLYILRAYRAGWRCESEIRFELDALTHLQRKKATISYPIPTRDGDLVVEIDAPEGKRFATLFSFAESGGDATDRVEIARQFGVAAAAIHAGTDDFHGTQSRFKLDLGHLIDAPLSTISPHLSTRSRDLEWLNDLAARLRSALSATPIDELDFGFCHGDLHGGNAAAKDGMVTFFDFDCCGMGWRAYDLAVFRWNGHHAAAEITDWDAFLDGYRQHRQLAEIDLRAVPLFVIARQIWFMGLLADIAKDFGTVITGGDFWDGNLKFLRDRVTECAEAGLMERGTTNDN